MDTSASIRLEDITVRVSDSDSTAKLNQVKPNHT